MRYLKLLPVCGALIMVALGVAACSGQSPGADGEPVGPGLTTQSTQVPLPVPAQAPAPPSVTAVPLPQPEPPGPYWVQGKLCGEDDCDNIPGRWRATGASTLYARPDSAAPVVARVESDEWVRAVEKRTRYSPQRGVVRVGGSGLKAGDVIYGPFADKDSSRQQVWHNGKRIGIKADATTPRIEWAPASPRAPSRVMWVRVERDNGPGGWLRDPSNFACMGEHPPEDEKC